MVHSHYSNKKVVQHLLDSMIENNEAQSSTLQSQKTIKQAMKAVKEDDEHHDDDIEFSSDEDDENESNLELQSIRMTNY